MSFETEKTLVFLNFGTRVVLVQVGTTDSVMGLPKALTEKLIREAL